MQFEVIRKSHKKSIVIGVSLLIILGVVLIARFTFAKYELIKSIKIAEGTINYKLPDFKIMAMYKQKDDVTCTEDSCYNELSEGTRMPSSGYAINETKSYCTLDNINRDSKIKMFTNENGGHEFHNLAKYDKCYIYFDKASLCEGAACNTILGNITVNEGTPDFSKIAQATCSNTTTCETTNGVYKTEDDDGDTYYFRGSVTNNYVKFAGFYWRIIRINGDGSIRLIYDGTSTHANGTNTTDSIAVTNVKFSNKNAVRFGSYTDNNAYVGFKYALGEVHGLGTKSNALTQLETWYTNNLSSYASKIDTNAGFCGDRTPTTSGELINGLGGTGTTTTYYGAYIRLYKNTTPTLTCFNKKDLYTISSSTKGNKSLTYPIGLITADEVSLSGSIYGNSNQQSYLYNGQAYWTMTPLNFNGIASIFSVHSYCFLNSAELDSGYGLRPVINLRPDTKFTFTGTGEKGTMTNPYIVN